jgi:hypothetical protein
LLESLALPHPEPFVQMVATQREQVEVCCGVGEAELAVELR